LVFFGVGGGGQLVIDRIERYEGSLRRAEISIFDLPQSVGSPVERVSEKSYNESSQSCEETIVPINRLYDAKGLTADQFSDDKIVFT
jgi:hypothetical protein